MGYRARKIVSNTIIYIILVIMSIIWLFPIAWLVFQSLDSRPYAFTDYMIPRNFTFDNYLYLFSGTDSEFLFTQWFSNTVLLAIVNCILSTSIVLLVSYAFSRLRFNGRTTIMKFLMIIGMFPGFMSLIAVYNILKIIGLHQSLFSLMLVYCSGAALGYFIAKGFFDTIPKDMEEAAKIDGASNFIVFLKIIIPLSKPILIYQALMAFCAPWGDYMMVNYLFGTSPEKLNVAAGLFGLMDRNNQDEYFTKFAAGAVVSAILPTGLFMFLQRYYIEGITGGSVK